MKKPRRNSRQRNRIYELLKDNPEHPTAQWIFDRLRQEDAGSSMGNIYRNLAILVEDGLIAAREFGDGIVHYDAITGHHYHFICEQCKSISDFDVALDDEITRLAGRSGKHIVKSHTIRFFGICDKCASKR
ncbi:MAG: transcriptional repressor [Spirochaetales bacterium]|nr:transcriptional repressor [Spirochaetales bacterium]